MSAERDSEGDKISAGFMPLATTWRCRVFGPELTRTLIQWTDVVCMTVFLGWYFFVRPSMPMTNIGLFPAPPLVGTMAGIATAATFLKTFAFPVRATHMLLTQGGFRLLLHPGDSLHGVEQFIPWEKVRSVTRVVGGDDSTRLLKIRIQKRRVLNIYPGDQTERVAREVRLNAGDRLTTTSVLWFMLLPLLQFATAALAVAVVQHWGVQMLTLGVSVSKMCRLRS